jgi:hypothetical protein
MLKTVKGIYENGHVTLEENLPVQHKVRVLVTLLDEAVPAPEPAAKRPFGLAKGSIQLAPDFDAPLDELAEYM